jgi:hypothetical protein
LVAAEDPGFDVHPATQSARIAQTVETQAIDRSLPRVPRITIFPSRAKFAGRVIDK